MKTFLLALTLFLSTTGIALADEHGHADEHEERIQHYAAESAETTEDALKLLHTKVAATKAVIDNGDLDDSDMEAIHEISYSLEAAVDTLRDSQQDEQIELIDALDEAVQAIHYASENHDVPKIKEWFTKLTTATKEVEHAF